MKWLRLKARTAARLSLQDAWQEGGPRVLTGLSVNAIAVVVASIATKKPAALCTIIAYPIFMVSAWCFFFIRRMRGWNRLWKREIHVTRTPGGPQINVALRIADPAHPAGPEFNQRNSKDTRRPMAGASVLAILHLTNPD